MGKDITEFQMVMDKSPERLQSVLDQSLAGGWADESGDFTCYTEEPLKTDALILPPDISLTSRHFPANSVDCFRATGRYEGWLNRTTWRRT